MKEIKQRMAARRTWYMYTTATTQKRAMPNVHRYTIRQICSTTVFSNSIYILFKFIRFSLQFFPSQSLSPLRQSQSQLSLVQCALRTIKAVIIQWMLLDCVCAERVGPKPQRNGADTTKKERKDSARFGCVITWLLLLYMADLTTMIFHMADTTLRGKFVNDDTLTHTIRDAC